VTRSSVRACEKCGAPMVFRPTKTGGYLLCARSPDCAFRRSAEELADLPPEKRPAGYEPPAVPDEVGALAEEE
jgi:ssDNA-binding Zn-finger/Zn-ribbon topoisomerase 1